MPRLRVSHERIADAVRKLDDTVLRSKLAEGALERAERCFNAPELFARVESLLEGSSRCGNQLKRE